jgi:hypothetical protein
MAKDGPIGKKNFILDYFGNAKARSLVGLRIHVRLLSLLLEIS